MILSHQREESETIKIKEKPRSNLSFSRHHQMPFPNSADTHQLDLTLHTNYLRLVCPNPVLLCVAPAVLLSPSVDELDGLEGPAYAGAE